MKFSIIGATGNVGRKTINILEKSKLDIEQLYLVASKNSSGKKIKFKGNDLTVIALDNYEFEKADITFFAAGSSIAEKYAKNASKKTIVIDNSKYFRMDKDVPLIVPEVNSEDIKKHKNIIANPNCSTIQMVLALKPLHKNYNIKRVVVSTYQAVSGAGKAAMEELMTQTKDFLEILEKLKVDSTKTTFLLKSIDENVFLSSRNLFKVSVVESNRASTYDMIDNEVLILDKETVEFFNNQHNGN